MSTNLTCGATKTYRRLTFGVSLEEVFPPGEIHPGLKNLLKESYDNVANSVFPVETILSRFQGSLHERLILKERLVLGREFAGLKISPGALLWVIRHFIGLLPTQLIPPRIADKKYFWLKMSKSCRASLGKYATQGRNNRELCSKLSRELLRLPVHNFLMVGALLNLLRMMAVLPGGEPKVNKSAVFALVKYFSSALFIRPFRPGCLTKVDKQYHPLTLYLVLKWPEICNICMESSSCSFDLPIQEIYLKPQQSPKCLRGITFSSNSTCQTVVSGDNVEEQEEPLIRTVPSSYYECDFLRDTACQTETRLYENTPKEEVEMESQTALDRQKCCCCLSGSHYEKLLPELDCHWNLPHRLENKQTFKRTTCCCISATNYETCFANRKDQDCSFAKRDSEPKYSAKTESGLTCTKPYSWDVDTSKSEIRNTKSYNESESLPHTEFIYNDIYLYDDYSSCNLICVSDKGDNSYDNIKMFDPVEKAEKCSQNEALREKTSEISWKCNGFDDEKLTKEIVNAGATSTPIGWNLPQNDSYRFNQIRKSLNEELKEKLSKMKPEDHDWEERTQTNKIQNSSGEDHGSTSSESFSKKPKKSKKSLISVTKIRSKLDFLRSFSIKTTKTKISVSTDQVNSRVKYEKMGSANSVL